MKLGFLLALVYGKTVQEVKDLKFDRYLGDYALLVLCGRVIGVVDTTISTDFWYRPAANENGFLTVEGAWKRDIFRYAELVD